MKAGRIIAHGTPAELAHDADRDVAALMDAPRRQAERLRAKLGAEV
jgi:osmoprotectant transport system ATP-binding protein